MREVKFRAWDKKNKQIAEVVAIDYLANEVMLDYSGKMYFLDFQYIELLQYTGLKDKNGTEIYEGDILQGLYHFPGTGWYDTGEGDYFISVDVKFENGVYKCGGFLVSEIAKSVKVIGNAYENLKLATQEE